MRDGNDELLVTSMKKIEATTPEIAKWFVYNRVLIKSDAIDLVRATNSTYMCFLLSLHLMFEDIKNYSLLLDLFVTNYKVFHMFNMHIIYK